MLGWASVSPTWAALINLEFAHYASMRVVSAQSGAEVFARTEFGGGGLYDYGLEYRQTAVLTPRGDYRQYATTQSGVNVEAGSVEFYNLAGGLVNTWDPAAGRGAFEQFHEAGGGLQGYYAETLVANAAGREGDSAWLTMRFHAPVSVKFAYAEAREPGVAAKGELLSGANEISFLVGSQRVQKSFAANLDAEFGEGRQEMDPTFGYEPFTWVTAPVTLGNPFYASIGVYFDAYASVAGDGFGFSAVGLEFMQGATFAGAWLRDANGEFIDDFTLVNDAGVDFRRSFMPVPEPSTYGVCAAAMMVVGAGYARWRGRRRV